MGSISSMQRCRRDMRIQAMRRNNTLQLHAIDMWAMSTTGGSTVVASFGLICCVLWCGDKCVVCSLLCLHCFSWLRPHGHPAWTNLATSMSHKEDTPHFRGNLFFFTLRSYHDVLPSTLLLVDRNSTDQRSFSAQKPYLKLHMYLPSSELDLHNGPSTARS